MSDDAKPSADYSQLIREQTRQVDIDSFRQRGVSKVNVINAKKINELISQAVSSIIDKLEDAGVQSLKDDRAQVILDSMNEFRRLVKAQQEAEQQQGTSQSIVEEQLRDLKAYFMNMQARSAQEHFTREAMIEQQAHTMAAQFEELKLLLVDLLQTPRDNGEERHALGQLATEIRALRAVVGAAASAGAGANVNAEEFERLVRDAVTSMKDDLVRDFEKGGLLKGVSKDTEAADSMVASSMVEFAFSELASGRAESNIVSTGRAEEKSAGDGGKAKFAIEKLKAMKKITGL